MRKLFLKLLILCGLWGFAACGGSNANLQTFNGSPDAPSLDFLINGETVAANLSPNGFKQYQEVRTGNVDLSVNEASTSRTLVPLSASFVTGQDYTLIALNSLNNIETLLLTDDNSINVQNGAKVRLVNAAPSSPSFDFYFTAPGVDLGGVQPLLTDLTFKEVSDYLVLGAGTYRVRVTQAGTKTVLIDSGNFSLTPGQVRTGITVDKVGGGTPFSIVFLPDKL